MRKKKKSRPVYRRWRKNEKKVFSNSKFKRHCKDKEDNELHTVWGATAYMIVTFIEKIYGFTLSELGLKRFKLDKIKHLKEYIKYRDQITKKF